MMRRLYYEFTRYDNQDNDNHEPWPASLWAPKLCTWNNYTHFIRCLLLLFCFFAAAVAATTVVMVVADELQFLRSCSSITKAGLAFLGTNDKC